MASWCIQPFGYNKNGPKIREGAPPPFWGGELGLHLTQCHLGRGLPPYQVASWSTQPFGHNRHGPRFTDACLPASVNHKSGGCCAHFRGGVVSPSNTMSPAPRPTSVPSGILIHPTVWAQYTNVTHRQDRQWFDSIGRTVTCNGCPQNSWIMKWRTESVRSTGRPNKTSEKTDGLDNYTVSPKKVPTFLTVCNCVES